MKRILILLLTFSLLLPILAACDTGEPEESASKIASTEGDWYHGLDFGGSEIVVRYNESDTAGNLPTLYAKGPDEKGGDTVLDRCYDRNREVAATLNLKISSRMGKNTGAYMEEIALMPSGCPDLVIMQSEQGSLGLAIAGYIRNVSTTPAGETSYFDFSKPYWYKDFMDGFGMGDGKAFVLAGDYFIDVLRNAECLYLNTEYYEEKMIEPLSEFYRTVERGMFDADQMQYMVELAYEDTKNQGYVDMDDKLGLIWRQGVSFFPWIYGANFSVIEKDVNGEWQIIDNPTEVYDLVDQLSFILNTDGAIMHNEAGGTPQNRQTVIEKFCKNELLFASMLRICELEDTKMLNHNNKLAVVYPKVHPRQSYYRTFINCDAELGYLPVQAKESHSEVSAYLELLNQQSTDIVDQYFQESLKFKYSTEPEGASRMLDVIYETIDTSIYMTILDAARNNCGYPASEVPQFDIVASYAVLNKTHALPQKWPTYREAYRYGLEEVKRQYAEMKE